MMHIIAAAIGYLVADAITGIYHWLTDNGYNLRFQVEEFQQHHDAPKELGIDLRPIFVTLFIAPLAFLCWPAFWLFLSFGLSICQITHYWAHHPERCGPVISLLQYCGLILRPKHHAQHHNGAFDRNFCTLVGWNNWWMNKVLLWRKYR